MKRNGFGRRAGGFDPHEDVVVVTANKKVGWIFASIEVLEVILITLLWGLTKFKTHHTYTVTEGIMDIVVFCWLRLVAFAALKLKMSKSLYYATVVLSSVIAVSKAIASDWSPDDYKHEKQAMLIVVLTTTTTHLLLCRSVVGGARKKIPTMKYIIVILRPYFLPKGLLNKLRAVLTWVSIIGAKICNIYIPLLMGKIVTDLTNGHSATTAILTYCCVALLAKGLKEAQNVIYVKVKQVAFAEMAEHVFQHIHNLSLEWHLRKKMGQVIRSMDRGTAAADGIVTYLFLYLIPTILECIVTFAMFYAHFGKPDLAAICLLSFALYIILTSVVTAWRRRFRESMNHEDNDYHTKATDSLINFETVKYFTAEERERLSFVESVKGYQKYGVVIQVTLSALNLSQQAIIYGCLFSSLYVSSKSVLDGSLKVGDFVAIQAYVMQLFTPLTFLGSVYNTVVMAFVNMQHLGDLLSETPDIQDRSDAVPLKLSMGVKGGREHVAVAVSVQDESNGYTSDSSIDESRHLLNVNDAPETQLSSAKPLGLPKLPIEFRDVFFRYPSADSGAGLQDISIKVDAGQKLAIVGETGCGKTTISRLLFRFYDLDKGQILINNQDISLVTQTSLRNAIGIVPQDTVLFNDTLKRNVMYGKPDATEEELMDVAKDAQLLQVVNKLPKGWDTQVGERGLRLSGGEKQRVAIARCLLKNPPIIVLDEATSALDSNTEKEILQVLQCLRGRTLVVIAHRLSTIQDSDKIVVVKDGRVVEEGTHQTLRGNGGKYDAMWKVQQETTPQD
eukprot:TRINITY_DN7778_c0_g5_i1.p1 TRINITY_DN7778_c0_g5~~TRINITY_DN7778_c0_g5_i1.p1  ORF type:complete len:805 (+),score=125.05 TRINITY_DN7778_c0_g5_i1:53-2416(+)